MVGLTAGRFSLIIAILAVCGMVVSYILIDHHVDVSLGVTNENVLCNVSAAINCDAAAKSRWSELFSVPIAAYGLFFYLMLLITSLVALDTSRVAEASFKDGVLALSLIASLVSIFLLIVSLVDVKSVCPYCLISYVVNFAILFIAARADRTRSMSERIKSGFIGIGTLPLLVSGIRTPEGYRGIALARGLSLMGMLIFLGSVFLPMYLYSQRAAAMNTRGGASLRAEMALQSWLANPSVDLEVILRPGIDGDQSKGAKDGVVQIVQFTDFECPMCRRFHATIEQILAKYPTHVQFVHKDFPLDKSCNPAIQHNMHESACYAAQVARCAGEQGKFWEVTGAIYTLPEIDSGAAAEVVGRAIMKRAEVLGLDTVALDECVTSKRYQQKILNDIRLGNALQIPGTPAVFVNGKPLQQLSFEALDQVVSYIVRSRPE